MEKVLYAELTPQEFRDRIKICPVAYLPLGTLEWHGEHLPLGADGLQSRGFFTELAKQVGGIVLPMLFLGPDRVKEIGGKDYYGMDTYAEDQTKDAIAGKSGNIVYDIEEDTFANKEGKMPVVTQLAGSAYWVGEETFDAILKAILKQLKRAGFRVVVAHGHGPSGGYFGKHIEEWEKLFGLRLFNCWGGDPEHGIQCDHAAANETSLVMALRPELVHMEYLSEDPETYPVAVGGKDPRYHASVEYGRKCIEIQAERMVKLIKEALQ